MKYEVRRGVYYSRTKGMDINILGGGSFSAETGISLLMRVTERGFVRKVHHHRIIAREDF